MSRNRVCSPRVVDTLPPHLPSTAGGCLSLGRCSVRMCSSWFRERQGGWTSSASLKLFTTFHVARRVPGFCRAVFPGPEYRALAAPLQASLPVRQEGAQRPQDGLAGGGLLVLSSVTGDEGIFPSLVWPAGLIPLSSFHQVALSAHPLSQSLPFRRLSFPSRDTLPPAPRTVLFLPAVSDFAASQTSPRCGARQRADVKPPRTPGTVVLLSQVDGAPVRPACVTGPPTDHFIAIAGQCVLGDKDTGFYFVA